MADAQITYDSKTISLKRDRAGINLEWIEDRSENTSSSGIIETIAIYDVIKFSFPAFFSRQIYYDLLAWWSWAKQGKAFAFAFSTARVASTTLDGAAAAAQKTVPLTATTGITSGDFLLLKKDDDDEMEVIEVDSVSAGVSVAAVANLKWTYASGDHCRHIDYFPAVKADMASFMPKIIDSARAVTSDFYYRYTFKFVEDKT